MKLLILLLRLSSLLIACVCLERLFIFIQLACNKTKNLTFSPFCIPSHKKQKPCSSIAAGPPNPKSQKPYKRASLCCPKQKNSITNIKKLYSLSPPLRLSICSPEAARRVRTIGRERKSRGPPEYK